MVECISV